MKSSHLRASLLFVLFAAVPAQAAAPVLTLHRPLLEGMIQGQFDPSELDPRVKLRGAMTVSRRSANSIWLHVPLQALGAIDFSLRIGLEVMCGRGHLFVQSAGVELQADDVLSWLGSLVQSVEAWVVDRATDALEANVLPATNLDMECPGIEVLSTGALQLDFGPGSQCRPGETRTQPCRTGTTGAGTVLRCANGRWEVDSYECEANPPSGGTQL